MPRGGNTMTEQEQPKNDFMHKLALQIVERRNLVFLIVILGTIFTIFSRSWVKVESDLTTYLPKTSETRMGLDIMEKEFTTYGSADVMVANITPDEADQLNDELAGLRGIQMIEYDDTTAHYNKEAVAVDDTTVEFHMNKPFSIWPYTMAIVGIVPEHAYDENYGQHPIGSGRYILKQWDKGQQVIFEANPDYYGEKAKIKKVTVLFMDEDAALAAAMAGQVDVAHTAASLADEKIDGYGLLSVTSVDNRGINLPTVKASEKDGKTVGNDVTSDVAIRRAMNIGIDREEMIKNVLNGHGTAAYSVCDKMPWYNEESEVTYDQKSAKALLDEAGWKEGKDGIREKDGVRAEFTVMFNPDDSVRQALAEDFANQCKELGIEVKTEGAGWDVAYDKALSQPLVWGWGAHTPMELYNIYHTGTDSDSAEYSPYANETVDHYMDEALQADTLEDSYDLWKKAQWDGTTGVTQDGDIPWIWFCNVDHLYYVRDGLKVAEQKIHPHGHGWSIVNNVDQWEWSK